MRIVGATAVAQRVPKSGDRLPLGRFDIDVWDADTAAESFRGLLLRHRGRTELTQRGLATRASVSLRSVQDWEGGTKFPSAGRLQGLIQALLGTGGLSPDREAEEARALWAAVVRDSPRMHTPFDEEWFAGLLAVIPVSDSSPCAGYARPGLG